MITILHIEDRFHPDMGYQINFFARYHHASIDFKILTSDSVSIWQGAVASKIYNESDPDFEQKYKVKIKRLPILMEKKTKYNVWLQGLGRQIRREKPDAIFVHTVEMWSTMRVLLNPLLWKYPIVTDTHTLYNQFSKSLKFKIYLYIFRNIFIRLINWRNITVFYTAEENREILKETYGVKPSLIKSCLIGTDEAVYHFDGEARKEIRSKLSIGQEETVLFYAGKFNNLKQPHLILEAISKIDKESKEDLHLVFVGPQNEEYIKTTFDLLLQTVGCKVHTVDAVKNTELYKYYSASDFAVFPKENTLSALDCQMCNLPLIMEDDFTNRERLKKGGLLYEQGNIDDLASKIEKLLKDKELRNKLGKEGFDYIDSNYNYKQIISNTEKHIMELVEKKNKKRCK